MVVQELKELVMRVSFKLVGGGAHFSGEVCYRIGEGEISELPALLKNILSSIQEKNIFLCPFYV